MITYDDYLKVTHQEHPLDQMDMKDIAAHLHASSLEEFFKCKHEFQPLDRVLDELLSDLYQGFAGLDILKLLIIKAMAIDPVEIRREVEEAMNTVTKTGVDNV